MTQSNTSCFWTQHLWTTVWLTVSAGAVFSNYPFSVEHFQPCCLHLPLYASRRPHSLILILVMKCNFRIIFFFREHHFIEDTKKGCNHCYKIALTRSALLVHLNTFALICGSTVIFCRKSSFTLLSDEKNLLYINIMNCVLWVLHPWLRTAHRGEGSWHWEDMWARAVLVSLPNQVYVMSYYSWFDNNCFNTSLL